jgi:hypothetical protein
MYVALRSARVSRLRCTWLLILALSASMLAKASSGIFLVPMIAYVIFSLFQSRDQPRQPATKVDRVLVVFATGVALLTTTWYATNWHNVVQHFRNSTVVGDVALFYGTPVNLSRKIPYWSIQFGASISPFSWLAAAAAITITIALLIAIRRAYSGTPSQWIARLWETGDLFALTLAGSVVLTILVFALQINEDTRYLISTTPMFAVLVGWSARILHRQALSVAIMALFLLNAVINHLISAGINPLQVRAYNYLRAPDLTGSGRRFLQEAVRATCATDLGDRWNMIAVSYKTINGNSATFYCSQINFNLNRRCQYSALQFASNDLAAGLDLITALAPAFVVTIDPLRQPPPDFVNRLSKPVAEWLAQNPRYVLDLSLPNGFLVYRDRSS